VKRTVTSSIGGSTGRNEKNSAAKKTNSVPNNKEKSHAFPFGFETVNEWEEIMNGLE
jgi:hypothetical protein